MAMKMKLKSDALLRFGSIFMRPIVINIIFGILIGSITALILRAALQVQVPHWPSPGDKAGAVPRDIPTSPSTDHHALGGPKLGQGRYTAHSVPILRLGEGPAEDLEGHILRGPTSSTTAA
eukprot:695579-Karenia_brevis.AAC.1